MLKYQFNNYSQAKKSLNIYINTIHLKRKNHYLLLSYI